MISPIFLSSLAEQFGGVVIHPDENLQITSVSINTRDMSVGDLFVALKGERFDAHDFVGEAQKQGASALVVEKEIVGSELPQWVVADTTHALGYIAQAQRDQFSGQLIAITGSSGKTTVKGMLESILRAEAGDGVFATKGNLNNHIGVPLSLLSLTAQHRYAVIEMGASAVGDIAYLTQMAKPHVAVVNNVMSAHVEGFGSIDNIAKGKGEIYDGLVQGGVAVINLTDQYAPQWVAKNAPRATLTFSTESVADVVAHHVEQQSNGCASFQLQIKDDEIAISLSVLGLHNVANALSAASCAHAAGIDLRSIKKGLCDFRGVAGRLQCLDGINSSTVIDDSYNANPDAFCAAIDVLADMSAHTVLVMGDMGELGGESAEGHRKVGAYAAQKNINGLLTLGEQSQLAHTAFDGEKEHFFDIQTMIGSIKKHANNNTVFLIKGSRSARMDRVVAALTSRGTPSC